MNDEQLAEMDQEIEERLRDDDLYLDGLSVSHWVAIRARLKAAEAVCVSADQYANMDSKEIHSLQGLIETWHRITGKVRQ